MHKRFLVGLFFLGIAPRFFAQTSQITYITYLEGTVHLNSSPAAEKMAIFHGDVLSTQENGRVEVSLDGSYIRLNYFTQIVFNLQEKPVLLDIRYGEVYVETEEKINIKTPHENFSVEGLYRGLYRIEVDRYGTKKFENPDLEDSFDKWNYQRQKELSRSHSWEKTYNYNYYYYDFSSGWYPCYQCIWYPRYPWSFYWYWDFCCWTGWYGFGWYYPYLEWYYPYPDYYYYSRYPYGRLTIHKSQLQARALTPPRVWTIPPQRSTKILLARDSSVKIKKLDRSTTSKSSLRSIIPKSEKIEKIYPSRSSSLRGSSTRVRDNFSNSSFGSFFSRSQSSSPSFRSSPSRSFSAPSRSFGSSRVSSGSRAIRRK